MTVQPIVGCGLPPLFAARNLLATQAQIPVVTVWGLALEARKYLVTDGGTWCSPPRPALSLSPYRTRSTLKFESAFSFRLSPKG